MPGITEKVVDNRLEISTGGDTLSIPTATWGHPDVRLNNNRIPSARFWALVASYVCEGVKPKREALVNEARRAEIYRLMDMSITIYTDAPREGDERLENWIYSREEKQRVRPLVDTFGVRLAKIESDDKTTAITSLVSFFAKLGYHPFASGDNRIMFAKDPEKIFNLFGTRDWVRLYVMFKRPGPSSVPLNINKMNNNEQD